MKLAGLLRDSGICKAQGIKVAQVFELLLHLNDLKQGIQADYVIMDTWFNREPMIRFILLEWLRQSENDDKTLCELFFRLCDDIQDMALYNRSSKSDELILLND